MGNNPAKFYVTKCHVVRKIGRFGDSAMYNGIFPDDEGGAKAAEKYRIYLREINDAENAVETKTKRKKSI